jgi:hypothetical protein
MPDPELTDIEKRLSGWRPAGDGLNADAMLFAAGRASAQRGPARFAWPAIAAGLAVAVGILSVELAEERNEHRVLLARFSEPTAPLRVTGSPLRLSESSYFIVRQAIERDLDAENPSKQSLASPPEIAPLRAGQRDFEFAR